MITDILAKQYDEQNYHCVHFAVDVWKILTDHDLSAQFAPMLTAIDDVKVISSVWDGFKETEEPFATCIVLMRSGVQRYHIGVYNDGRILHMRETGPHASTIVQLRREYKDMRFFKCVK